MPNSRSKGTSSSQLTPPAPAPYLSTAANIALALITAITSIAAAWITANVRAQPAAESAVEQRTGDVAALAKKVASVQADVTLAHSDATSSIIPKGTIVAWATSSGPIPQGWQICNGDGGTPNLVGKFLRGVGTLIETGPDPDGRDSHKHSFITAPSRATISYTTDRGNDTIGVVSYDHTHTGETDAASNIPPNFRVVYIVKI